MSVKQAEVLRRSAYTYLYFNIRETHWISTKCEKLENNVVRCFIMDTGKHTWGVRKTSYFGISRNGSVTDKLGIIKNLRRVYPEETLHICRVKFKHPQSDDSICGILVANIITLGATGASVNDIAQMPMPKTNYGEYRWAHLFQ